MVAMAGSLLGFAITLAAKGGAAWPFEIVFVATVACYGYGLTIFGADKPGPGDGSDAEHEEPAVPIRHGP